ncbi:MAG: alpha/beta fold hydrolase [Gemmataceae bacterium]|nr:alpha/beta fold hydrolase [Gemmataceae bacterium]
MRYAAPALLLLAFLIPSLRAGEPRNGAPFVYPPPDQVRAAFLKLLDRPKVPADPRIVDTKPHAPGWVVEQLSIASEKKADGAVERVPMLIVRPEAPLKRLPAVIVLHGTGGAMRSQLGFMKELAARNLIGVAIDARYHGARAHGAKGASAYQEAIVRAWKARPDEALERPFYYDTCWDLWRVADYLESRPDVDGRRLGMIGFSMGGIQTWLAASVDERIRVAVPAIAVQSFRWSLDNEQWHGRARTIKAAHDQAAKDLGEQGINAKVCRALWDKIVPGIVDQFDCPSMLRLFAGRALLILNGTKDANCPYDGARLAIAAAERAFEDANARDKLKVMIADVGHQVTAEQRAAALEWLERWLVKE